MTHPSSLRPWTTRPTCRSSWTRRGCPVAPAGVVATLVAAAAWAVECDAVPTVSGAQELPHDLHEGFELVVVHPVPGVLDHHVAVVVERARLPVLLRIGRPAFRTADQQGRAADLVPDLPRLSDVELVRRVQPDVVVELPAPACRRRWRSSHARVRWLRHLAALGADSPPACASSHLRSRRIAAASACRSAASP